MIQTATMKPEQLQEAAIFTARLQAMREHHISYFDQDAEEIEHYLRELQPAGIAGALLAFDANRLVGLMAVEADPELKRAWLHGPLVDHDDWHTVADVLYAAALRHDSLKGINDYELAGDTANTRLYDFALRHGYEAGIGNAVLHIRRENVDALPPGGLPEMTATHQEGVIRLHDRLFPGTYYSGQQVVGLLDDVHRIFVAAENENVLAYIFVQRSTATEGYIDFLGVAENARRRGLGQQLIAAGARWLFTLAGVQQVALTVRDDNTGAIALYQQAGFQMERAIRGYRKKF